MSTGTGIDICAIFRAFISLAVYRFCRERDYGISRQPAVRMGIQQLTGVNIASAKWLHLVDDLNPAKTPVILHASIAGVFLFLSGIIAGSISNRDKHNSVYYRIQEHPWLKKLFGKTKTDKIAAFYEKKWAGIVSNLWFGVFMGSTASIGMFLGLNLDIRHITFASGNLALGLLGIRWNYPQISGYGEFWV
nr:site-specific recombinase [Sphingobacterium sp. E70]